MIGELLPKERDATDSPEISEGEWSFSCVKLRVACGSQMHGLLDPHWVHRNTRGRQQGEEGKLWVLMASWKLPEKSRPIDMEFCRAYSDIR